MTSKIDLSGYVDVAERIDVFRAKHPDGTIQTRIVELPEAFAGLFIAVEATVYRGPDDVRPGVEMAWEPVPGKTPFTRDSELMNASTSAIGRALIAVGAADAERGIASADEVRNRQPLKPVKEPMKGDGPRPVNVAKLKIMELVGGDKNVAARLFEEALIEAGLTKVSTMVDAAKVIDAATNLEGRVD